MLYIFCGVIIGLVIGRLLWYTVPDAVTPAPDAVTPAPAAHQYDPISRMPVRKLLLLVFLLISSTTYAASIAVMDPFTKGPKALVAGDGIAFTGSTISATGIPAGGVTQAAFDSYSAAQAVALAGKLSTTGTAANSLQLGGEDAATVLDGAAKGATALQPDNEVYAASYNGGALNSATIIAAITGIGSATKTLVLSPGDWAMSTSVTIPANITLRVMHGAVIVRTSGDLTINGPLEVREETWLKGFTANRLKLGSKITQIYADWSDAVGDGTTNDSAPICSIINAGSPGANVYLNGSKKYNVSDTCYSVSSIKLWGNGATIVNNAESVSLSFGGGKTTLTGQAVEWTAGVNTFTLPAGHGAVVGDLVVSANSTPYSTSGSSYQRGVFTEITKIVGNLASISVPAKTTFTADTFQVLYRVDGLEVHDLIFDNSATTLASSGMWVQGKDIEIDNIEAQGSYYANAGMRVTAMRGLISNVQSTGYIGQAPYCITNGGDGGRPCGYGMTVYGHAVTIDHSTFADSKHSLSLSLGEFTSSGIEISNSFITQDPALYGVPGAGTAGPLYMMALDMHNNISEVYVHGTTIIGASDYGAVSIRGGGDGVKFYGNTIHFWNNTGNKSSIFKVQDADLVDLDITNNTITAVAADTPLVVDGNGFTADPALVKTLHNRMINITHAGNNPPLDNVSGTASGLSAAYIDWAASSGGSSIANKPVLPSDVSCASGNHVSAFVASTGAYTCTADTGTTEGGTGTVNSGAAGQFATYPSEGTAVSGHTLTSSDVTTALGFTPGTGSVTGVSSANGDITVSQSTPTPSLTLNSGTGNNQIVKRDASGKFPAISASGKYDFTGALNSNEGIYVNNTGTAGTGVWAAGTANGVYAYSPAGLGFSGASTTGKGGLATSELGVGMEVSQTGVLVASIWHPTLYVRRAQTLGAYNSNYPIIKGEDITASAGDLLELIKQGATKFKVTNTGAVTAGAITGTTISATANTDYSTGTAAPSTTGNLAVDASAKGKYEFAPTGTTTQSVVFSGNPSSGKVRYVTIQIDTAASGVTTLAWPTVGSTFGWMGTTGFSGALTASKRYKYVCEVGPTKTECGIAGEGYTP